MHWCYHDILIRIEKLEEELKSEKAKSDVLLEQQRLIKMLVVMGSGVIVVCCITGV